MLQNLCDTHTHTLYSRHAYSTIRENVLAARDAGLELLGSTEHFSCMLFPEQHLRNFQFFFNMNIWPREWEGVRLLRGCEADVVDLAGNLFGHDIEASDDITGAATGYETTLLERVQTQCDYLIASVHNREFAEGASLARPR